MSDARDELAMPNFEDRLWDGLAEAYAQHPAVRRNGTGRAPNRRALRVLRGGGPGRRPLALAIVGVAAVVALVVVAMTMSWSQDAAEHRPERVETIEIDIPSPEVLAARITQAVEADAAQPAIVHETWSYGDGLDRKEVWYDEVTSAGRELTTTADGEHLLDWGWRDPPTLADAPADRRNPPVTGFDQCVGGMALDEQGNLYQCDTGEPAASGLPPAHPARVVNHCQRVYVDSFGPVMPPAGLGYISLYLQTGGIVIDGTVERDGRPLIRLRNGDGDYGFLVDPETYRPVESFEPAPDGGGQLTKTYERLERTEENLAALAPVLPDGYEQVVDDEVLHADLPEHYVCEENPAP